ncbi:DUF3119 family protein [Pseudanabaena sp. FACHB-2040]|uniref:DUF3119 family protein n=1 Tax=Pseudanabaena sp. FACHB-2040 TaxID=2692859 RepID=UPI001688CF7E|nr:DUF3119 family protein [Cyanobacteria bacterium Co-bin8]MBD2259160.1 DUF3119 family protein [Pseudanabaena sp. FACHB-2040]
MDSTQSATAPSELIELAPSYRLPLGLVVLSIPLFWLQLWAGGAVALLGLLLLFQAVTLRLRFTSTALDIYRGEQCIRHFPYQDWLNWEIFWSPVPILFYFKEVNSIHFLPIIFSPSQLRTCLEQHCPRPVQTS